MTTLFSNARMLDNSTKYLLVEDEYIKYIGSERPGGSFDRVIDCTDKLLMPGLYNCHTHSAMTIFRGYGEDMPLSEWLNNRIFPAEDLLTPESVYTASKHAAAEMLRNGIVSYSDMYFFCDNTVRAAAETGIKANISRSVVSFDNSADMSSDARAKEGIQLFEEFNNYADGRIKIDLSLHAEYTNVEGMCRYYGEEAKRLGAIMHVHVSETEKEHLECIERHGKTPTEFLADCGVFDAKAIAAHCVYLSDNDISIFRDRGVTAVHNPVSNLKLGSGVMPLIKYLDNNVNVALGTDGAASNNTLDVFKEMNYASLLQKGINRLPQRPLADEIIKLATVNGAFAQNRADCGVLAEGYKADIILVDLAALNNIPYYDMTYTAVYSANSSNVCLTMVDGKILYENGEYTTIDIEKLKYDMRETYANYFKKQN